MCNTPFVKESSQDLNKGKLKQLTTEREEREVISVPAHPRTLTERRGVSNMSRGVSHEWGEETKKVLLYEVERTTSSVEKGV